ncbi:MAG: MarC family protein [Elusimicrobiaceae bacterium]|nr:MarC family protein [Elusimicrobiaceae bacterium]
MNIDFSLALNFFIALLAILNPIGNIPIFLEHVNSETAEVQKNIAVLLASTIFFIILFFYFTGQPFLSLFGITIPAFRIAGGILIMTIGFRLLHGKPKFDPDGMETNAEASPFSIATKRLSSIIVPVATPIFVGPGAITTVILYSERAESPATTVCMVLAIAFACLLIGAALYMSRWFFKILKRNGMQIVSRTMGLILCAIAVQFVIEGVAQLVPNLIDPTYLHIMK